MLLLYNDYNHSVIVSRSVVGLVMPPQCIQVLVLASPAPTRQLQLPTTKCANIQLNITVALYYWLDVCTLAIHSARWFTVHNHQTTKPPTTTHCVVVGSCYVGAGPARVCACRPNIDDTPSSQLTPATRSSSSRAHHSRTARAAGLVCRRYRAYLHTPWSKHCVY